MIYGKITMPLVDSTYYCDEPILNENIKTVDWLKWHPDGSQGVFQHQNDAILLCPHVAEINEAAALMLRQEYENTAPPVVDLE